MDSFSKIKLVVSDMDGTLLNPKGEVSRHFFDLFKKMQKHNIIFCAASGRQYNSIVQKFAPIKNDIFVIAENGGIAKKQNELLLLNKLEAKKVAKIIPVLRAIKDTHIVICTKDTAYIETTDKDFVAMFHEYYTAFKIVNDLTEVVTQIDVLKIAIYHSKSSEKFIYPSVKHLKNNYLLKISGKNWVDISDAKANKGNALKVIQKQLNITKEETMVFGDYHNDLEMLQEAHFSFAMKNAHPNVKETANYITETNENFGVETILKKLIEVKEKNT